MNRTQAGRLAALGVLLRGLFHAVNASWAFANATLVTNAVLEPIVWTAYFLRPNRATAWAAAALTAGHTGFEIVRQWSSFSALSLDTLSFFFGSVLVAACWIALLLEKAKRIPRSYLLVTSGIFTALAVYQVISSAGLLLEFGRAEPWRLVIAPLIWILYWFTQALYVRAIHKA